MLNTSYKKIYSFFYFQENIKKPGYDNSLELHTILALVC